MTRAWTGTTINDQVASDQYVLREFIKIKLQDRLLQIRQIKSRNALTCGYNPLDYSPHTQRYSVFHFRMTHENRLEAVLDTKNYHRDSPYQYCCAVNVNSSQMCSIMHSMIASNGRRQY